MALPLWLSAEVPLSSPAAEVQLQFADLLLDESRFDEAIAAYERAKTSEQSVQRYRALVGIVKASLRTADFSRALVEAQGLKALGPQSPEAIALYADALWSAGQFEEAEAGYRDALSLDGNLPRGRHGLARALAARNQLDEALAQAQSALVGAPREGEFHHTVGAIYEQMHLFEEAAIAFSNYVNLLPNKDKTEKASWSRAEIRFLRSFGRRRPIQIEGDHPEMLHTVPFRLVRDKVVVKGIVNGGGERDLVLDTGAEQTVLSRRTAASAGVAPIIYTLSAGVGDIGLRGLQVGRIDTLQIGTLKVSNIPCLIKNPSLTGLPTREADSFSPLVLGMSMTIDYQRKLLTIGRTMPQETNATELPLRLHRLAMVRGTVKNQPVNFVVDTGGEVISISSSTASALDVRPVRRIPLKVYGTSGWDRDAFLLPGLDLAFQNIRFSNFPVVVLNLRAPSALLGFQLGGIVGHRFLSKYRVGIDLQRSVLTLKAL
jgi:predicted aspartyl protease